MELNFKEFKVFSGISHKDYFVIDLRERFADVIYTNVAGIAALELARKIFKSEGNLEYSDNEIAIIQRVKTICTPQLVESLDVILETNKNNK